MMYDDDKDLHLVEEYFGFHRRTLHILVALIASVLVVVTGIYISIFGFEHWRANMERAGAMMVINFQAPLTQPESAQFTCPQCGLTALLELPPDGSAPHCPNCGTTMNPRP